MPQLTWRNGGPDEDEELFVRIGTDAGRGRSRRGESSFCNPRSFDCMIPRVYCAHSDACLLQQIHRFRSFDGFASLRFGSLYICAPRRALTTREPVTLLVRGRGALLSCAVAVKRRRYLTSVRTSNKISFVLLRGEYAYHTAKAVSFKSKRTITLLYTSQVDESRLRTSRCQTTWSDYKTGIG